MANPYGGWPASATVKGVWLLPYGWAGNLRPDEEQVFVAADGVDLDRPVTSGIFEASERESKLVSLSRPHLHEGSVTGQMLDRFGATATQWASRLRRLVDGQRDYTMIALVSRDLYLPNVRLTEGYSLSPRVHPKPLWEVSFEFTEIGL